MKKTSLALLLLFSLSPCFGQKKVFIPPNTVVSIDTSAIEIADVFDGGENQTLSFRSKNPDDTSFYLGVTTSLSAKLTEKLILESMEPSLDMVRNSKPDSFDILSVNQYLIDGFIGWAMSGRWKTAPDYVFSSFVMARSDSNGSVSIYSFQRHQPDTSIHSHAEFMEKLIASLRTYSQKELDSLTHFYENHYSIEVRPLPLENRYTWVEEENGKMVIRHRFSRDSVPEVHRQHARQVTKYTFRGELNFKPALTEEVHEIQVDMGEYHQIFQLEKDGRLIITCEDEEKGELHKTGRVILILENGVRVVLPFSFSYINSD